MPCVFSRGVAMVDLNLKQQVDLIVSHFNRGALVEVVKSSERFNLSFPKHSFGWRAMGAAYKKLGRLDEAIACMQRALQIDPNDLEALQNIAITYRALRHFDLAEHHVRRALSLKPTSAPLHRELGDTLLEQGRLVEAETSHRQSLAIDARQPRAYANLAVALQQQGKIEEAIAACEHALRLDTNLWVAWNNLLMSSQYSASLDVERYRSQAATFGRLQSDAAAGRRKTQWRCADGEKVLRVGFVSADLYAHPVGFFFQSLLEATHRNKALGVECYVYSATAFADDVTQQLKRHCAQWRDVFHLDPVSIAQQIVDDGIHVLMDLSGHSAGNQLAVFAQKPAPVCVSWLGYFASTGMPEMDYVVTDPRSVLPRMRDQFCEQLLPMPVTRLCFAAPSTEVEIGALPARRNGHITFGTFQNVAKINDDTLDAWSRVLQAVAGSRFRMQFAALGDPAARTMFEKRLIKAGIDLRRVELIAAVNRSQYLAAHNEIDMLLDTFPFPGGTTTCEALWMGVPTLTLGGHTMISRQGVSMLACVGLEEWIVENVDEYVAAAAKFAGDLNQLAALRAQLRAIVTASPLFDSDTFASDFAALLKRAWRETGAKRVEHPLP
jgi:protein O-GlcNAc transferase